MIERTLTSLDQSLEEIKVMTSEEYHATYFNDADAQDYALKVLGLMEHNKKDDICTYFQQVRFNRNKNRTWHLASTNNIYV